MNCTKFCTFEPLSLTRSKVTLHTFCALKSFPTNDQYLVLHCCHTLVAAAAWSKISPIAFFFDLHPEKCNRFASHLFLCFREWLQSTLDLQCNIGFLFFSVHASQRNCFCFTSPPILLICFTSFQWCWLTKTFWLWSKIFSSRGVLSLCLSSVSKLILLGLKKEEENIFMPRYKISVME